MFLDLHTHTIASGHGSLDTIERLAKTASQRGIKLLGISDHAPGTLGSAKPSYFKNLRYAPKERHQIHLLYGVELNISKDAPYLDLDEDTLSHLDYAIASMHIQNYKPQSKDANTALYIEVMKNPYVRIIGHCDDVKFPVDYRQLTLAAKDYNVFLELNESSLSPDGYRGDTRANNLQLLSYAREFNHPLLIASDSHGALRVGSFSNVLRLLEEVNFPKQLILNSDLDLFYQYWNR
ncbi:MAG TPA: PHP domain-containing protein [Lachnospiraceae bacterium]